MEEKKNPERLDYTKEEYKTERKRGTIFAFLGLILMVMALSVFVLICVVKVLPPSFAGRVFCSAFLVLGLGIAMNGLVMISAADIKLERSIGEDVNELGKLVDEVKEETEKARKDNKGEEPKR